MGVGVKIHLDGMFLKLTLNFQVIAYIAYEAPYIAHTPGYQCPDIQQQE
jgi:hypothetical protein